MKVRDLQKLLEQCKPEAEVELFLNTDMVDRNPVSDEEFFETSFEPVFQLCWKTQACEGKADYLNIGMPAE